MKNSKTPHIELHQFPNYSQLSAHTLIAIAQKTCREIGLNMQEGHFIFVDDTQLAHMHDTYLNDPEVTDVITFNMGEGAEVEGEVYISYDRAAAQAAVYNVSVENEIIRLVIHALLHLAGYDDIAEKDRLKMKKEENRLVEQYSV